MSDRSHNTWADVVIVVACLLLNPYSLFIIVMGALIAFGSKP